MSKLQNILDSLTPTKRALLAARNPLSFAQQRLWFLDQLAPGQASYNIPAALRLAGPLNVPALERSVNEILRRHDALRTVFGAVEGRPLQLALPAETLALPVRDLSALPAAERAARLTHWMDEEAARPFDPACGPLFRIELWRLAAAEHVLWLNWHHIIADGWSLEIFFRELATLYHAFARDKRSPLPELPLQYGDYARWQRQQQQGEEWQRQLRYWKTQLQGAPASLSLPTDSGSEMPATSGGATYRFRLPNALTVALRELSRRENVTLFMSLLAAFNAVLARHTGETDFVVGAPQTNRSRVELEGLIGFFLNTLVLRADLSGKVTTRELLRRTRDTVLAAHAHQDLPFEALVDELQPARQPNQQPLFQVAFTLKNAALPAVKLPELDISALPTQTRTAKFDLSLGWTENAAGLEGVFEYRADLFAPATIERWAERLQLLLQGMTAQPDVSVARLPLLAAAERRRVLREFNPPATLVAGTQCVHEWVDAQAARQPDRLAIAAGEERLTYRQLNERANQLARRLRRLGVGPETRVGICLEPSARMVTAMLAVLKSGGAYVPFDPAYPAARLAWMTEDAGVRVLLTRRDLRAPFAALQAAVICLDDECERIRQESGASLNRPAGLANAAYIVYTSGSTGQPKGVAVTHAGLMNLVCWHQQAFNVTSADRATQLAGVGFDACAWELWPHLAAGASVWLPNEETRIAPQRLRDWLIAQEITIAFLPTPLAEAVLSLPWPAATRLRVLLTGGDRLHQHPPAGLPFALVNNYGPTECTVVASSGVAHPSPRAEAAPDIGRPIANTQIYLLDGELQPVPQGVVGEVYLGGASLARGYHRQPALTAERFVPNSFSAEPGARLYRTGDLARHRADGTLEFAGRADRQVKLRGVRIELGEIEAALQQHSAVKHAVAELCERAAHGPQLVAYVVPANGTPPLAEDLRRFLQARLPAALLPASFVMLSHLPLTPNGKVDRRALPAPEALIAETSDAHAPRDGVELKLARLWEELLNCGPVGVRDDFFARGGHSLLAVRLCARIEQEFGRNLPLRAVFQTSTLEQLAEQLRQGEMFKLDDAPLVALQPMGTRRPFFCVHPVGGDVWCYAALARRLGQAQPFFGLQTSGQGSGQAHRLETSDEPCARIETMAAEYLTALRAQQPAGPYSLGGWSLGGVIALEMARQLAEAGEAIALLALFDSALPQANEIAALLANEAELWRSFARQLGLSSGATARSPEDLLAQAKAAGVLPATTAAAELARRLRVFNANLQALRDYRPKPYAGRITLWQAADRPAAVRQQQAERWRAQTGASIQVFEIPGTHHTLLREPNVAALAADLDRFLDTNNISKQ